MNSDFRLSIGYFRHPKLQKLKRRLGSDAVLAHVQLLSFAAQERPTGVLTNMDTDDVAIACDYMGDMAALVLAMIDLRLVDTDASGVLSLHDWAEHNPWAVTAPERSEAGRNAANIRWETEREKTRLAAGSPPSSPSSTPARPPKSSSAGKPPTRTKPAEAKPAETPTPTHESALPVAPERNADNATVDANRNAEVCAAHEDVCGSHESALPVAPERNAPFLSYPSESFPLLSSPSESSEAEQATTTDTPAPVRSPPAAPTADKGQKTEETEAVVALLASQGISESSAQELCQKYQKAEKPLTLIRQYVADHPARIADRTTKGQKTDDPPGLLWKAIFEGYSRPASVQQVNAQAAQQRRAEDADAERRERELAALQGKAADVAKTEAWWSAMCEEDRRRLTTQVSARFAELYPDHARKQRTLLDGGDWEKMPPGPRGLWREMRDALLEMRDAVLAEQSDVMGETH